MKEEKLMMFVNRFLGYVIAVMLGCAITIYFMEDKQDDMVTTRVSVMREDEVIEI